MGTLSIPVHFQTLYNYLLSNYLGLYRVNLPDFTKIYFQSLVPSRVSNPPIFPVF